MAGKALTSYLGGLRCRLLRRGDLGFEVGDALVVKPEVLPCGLEFLLEGAVAGGERADALLERGVLGGDPLDGFLGPFGLQVPDLAEELADAGALGGYLVVGGLEGAFGVQRPLTPGGLAFVVLGVEDPGALLAGLGDRGGDGGPGVGVAVEEGAGHVRPAADRGDADLRFLPAEPGDRVTDAAEGGLGAAPAGGQGRFGAHAHASVMSSPSCSSPPAVARSDARKAVLQTRWK